MTWLPMILRRTDTQSTYAEGMTKAARAAAE